MKVCVKRRFIQDDGAAAVEFALISPFFILMVFGIVCFGYLFSVYNGLQQLAAESARASVAGLSDTERTTLAQSFVQSNVASYGMLDPTQLQVSAQETPGANTAFAVKLTYDLSKSFVYQILRTLPLPSPIVSRSAVVQMGGF